MGQCSIVTDEDLRGRNVLHFNLFPLLHDCSTMPSPTYAVAMSLYQIIDHSKLCSFLSQT